MTMLNIDFEDLDALAESKLEEFKKDYDLDELTSNDKLSLKELARTLARLDIYNEMFNRIFKDTLGEGNRADMQKLKLLQKFSDDALNSASKLQTDLRIVRKNRKSEEASVEDYIKNLKYRAKKFLESRLSYIYCPKCKTLVSTLWLLDYESGSRFKFTCPHCNTEFIVNDFELVRRTNDESRLVPTRPES